MGGIERVSYEIAKRLSKNNQLIILSHRRHGESSNEKDFIIHQIPSINIPRTNFWVFAYIYFKKRMAKKLVKKYQPDVIYCHNPYDSVASLGLGIPVVTHIHSLYTEHFLLQDSTRTILPKSYWKWFYNFRLKIEKKALSQSNLVITYSNYLMELSKERGAKYIKIIPNGIDTNIFNNNSGKYTSMKKPAILFTGRLEKLKGIEYLLKAAEQLPDLNFYLVGEKKDEYHFPKNVSWLGSKIQSEIPKYLRGADIFINPVLRDGFEIANIEAMACGIPVITTDAYERSELYRDHAVLVKPADSNALIRGIKQLLNNQDYSDNLVKGGIEFSSNFNWDKISKNIEQEIKSVLK